MRRKIFPQKLHYANEAHNSQEVPLPVNSINSRNRTFIKSSLGNDSESSCHTGESNRRRVRTFSRDRYKLNQHRSLHGQKGKRHGLILKTQPDHEEEKEGLICFTSTKSIQVRTTPKIDQTIKSHGQPHQQSPSSNEQRDVSPQSDA